MIFLRSLVFNILYASWAMLSAIIFAPLFLISSDASQKAGAPWAYGVLFLARIICGIRYEVRGREYILDKPVIYASKHQSAWDTVIFLTLLPHPAYVLKRSLLRIPLWGWYLWRMKMIAIDRSGKASSLKQMVRDAKDTLANGRSIVIYPEGTRTRPGAEPLYHPGIIAMYNQLDVSVVPVALNSGLLWGRDAFIKRPGTITIEFLPAIPSGIDKKQFANTLQNTIESATSRLIANP
ncbi:MAG: lysophospholipid acyltransferase family protein [Alphaproteobacteria bacterium]